MAPTTRVAKLRSLRANEPISGATKLQQQTADELARISDISMNIREAIRRSLPGPAEQFFTVMVPGKVLNLDELAVSFDAKGKSTTVLLPNAVQLAEAMLCDDMPALSPVQLGPTGKSVARSYDATLSKLCPSGVTIGIDDPTDGQPLTQEEERYKYAMDWLTGEDPKRPGKTRIDNYREKQAAYTAACEKKTKEFNDELARVSAQTSWTVQRQREEYDRWVAENAKTYRNFMQAAYMDWVTIGKKEETEYWFSIVDNDSAMSRVEASKEAMRASTINDADGSSEFYKVHLTPSNWAWLAQQKAQGGFFGETVETLTWKISRLEKINMILQTMEKDPKQFIPLLDDPADPDLPTPNPDPVKDFLEKNIKLKEATVQFEKSTNKTDSAKKALEDLANELETARKNLAKYFDDYDKAHLHQLNEKARKDMKDFLDGNPKALEDQIKANNDLIAQYKAQRDQLKGSTSFTEDIQDTFAAEAGIVPAGPDYPANPDPAEEPNFWTSISLEVSSSYAAEQSSFTSTSISARAAYGYGLFSIGGKVSHSSVTANAAKQLANSSVKVSFDCMRVDITRPWLRSELFYDDGLKVAHDDYISPGPVKLANLMDPDTYISDAKLSPDDRERELLRYSLFPMYPVAFLLAANVVLEVEGETEDIQAHFASSTTSASLGLGWGPFSISTNFSRTSTHADSMCEATANGCKITIQAPQIIGWVSEMVPAQPRNSAKQL